MRLKNLYQKLKPQTKICKICLNSIQNTSYFSLINENNCICEKCMKSLQPTFRKFKVEGIQAISIFDYDETVQKLIYQFKGCYDYELHSIFLNQFKKEIKIMFHGYNLVCAPSFYTEDRKREYNHVQEIFKDLNLPILNIIEKTDNIKQANLKKNERSEIGKILKLSHTDLIENKRILVVDDVYTTGSTVRAIVHLLMQFEPKKIKILVLSKTIDFIKRIDKNA